jgi:penicillin amidase
MLYLFHGLTPIITREEIVTGEKKKASLFIHLCLITTCIFLFFFDFTCRTKPSVPKETIAAKGISHPVEIIKDIWGISHIYARNQEDLFFAQGFNVARDRLFQLEIWRRQATGTLAEILGHKALKKDIGSRLLKARVDMEKELSHYHPQGKEIIGSFVRGINAYIDLTKAEPSLLPLEFKLLGLEPGHWTPDVVISRHNGLFRNARTEVSIARSVLRLGEEKTRSLLNLEPGNSDLVPDECIDLSLFSSEIMDLYSSARSPVLFESEDIVEPIHLAQNSLPFITGHLSSPFDSIHGIMTGSNNWVVKGILTDTGYPFMANDPHRSLQIPSLRYWIHLNAPGWHVIGGGEPALPGVSIGHNDYGAWGLTIFAIDQEDLYVYDTNPQNPDQYKYQENWEEMTVLQETIPVKDKNPVTVDLKYTRHGPVLYEDREHNKAYSLRAAWLEIGGAPYLASLRMDQAANWEEFREACSFSHTPSENMVWADRKNNIGWQAVGITPIRKNWMGLLPVPGDGRFEWEGYLPIKDLPHVFNPPEGYFATANQNNVPEDFPYSLGFLWSEPYRFMRIEEVLKSGKKFTLGDMKKLQLDYLSIPARNLVPYLKALRSSDQRTEKTIQMLLAWDFVLDENSVEPTIFMAWFLRLRDNVRNLLVPETNQYRFPELPIKTMIESLARPDDRFGADPESGRNAVLVKSLEQGLKDLDERLGSDISHWQYGQEKFHHIVLHHMLSLALSDDFRAKFDTGLLPRGGSGFTVNMTGDGYNQTSGASFRIIVDCSDWDNSAGTNCPGQSGNPESPHYKDLFEPWGKGQYFPVHFSRQKVESAAEDILVLNPIK